MYNNYNNLINKCQIGFSKKARTSDHIFVLKTLIDKYINRKGGKLFVCFIDIRKAFDTVIHAGIRYKLIKYGISGKLYSIIKDMYRKSELCVRINNKITPTFKSFVGVKQGDVLSPNLFKLFLNDLPEIFKNASGSVNVNNNRIDCLMYADDIVIFSETQEGLQKIMDLLHTYCSNWCLSVNLSKTNVVIFNKNGLATHILFKLVFKCKPFKNKCCYF
jgi:hypothetical protein